MQTEPDKNFKKQFKSMFIKSIKLGFNLEDIRKKLKTQSYPSDLANKLIEELKSDKDIINLLKPKKPEPPKETEQIKKPEPPQELKPETKPEKKVPGFFQKLKNKLFKPSESKTIKYITKIHSLYYNTIITQKIKLTEEHKEINNILENSENKKLKSYFIKSQKGHIKIIQKNTEKILKIAKLLINIKLNPKTKQEINKILKYVQILDKDTDQELRLINHLKYIDADELRREIIKERNKMQKQESNLQRIINEISSKSSKFKEAVSQI